MMQAGQLSREKENSHMNRTVREVMHQGVLTCTPDTSIQLAAKQMVEQDVSALVVVNTNGHMIGLLSRTDLVKVRLDTPDKAELRTRSVANIMTTDVVSVHADDTLQTAAELIMGRHIHRVVVIEDEDGGKKPVGILSITDMVRDLAD
jgi:CBS domain-containing protein